MLHSEELLRNTLTSKGISFSELENKNSEYGFFVICQEQMNICLSIRELERVTLSLEDDEHLASNTVRSLNADSEKVEQVWKSVTAQYKQEGLLGLPCVLLYYLYEPTNSDFTTSDRDNYDSSSSHLLLQKDGTVVWASSEQEIYDDDELAFISAEGFLDDDGDILFFHNCNANQPIINSQFCHKFPTHFFRSDTPHGSTWRKVII